MAARKPNNFRSDSAALKEQIRSGNYAPVYLVMGDQDYLRTQFRDIIRNALLDNGDAMNAAYYTGDQFTITEIVDLAETMPFLAQRRVITIENSWLFHRGGGNPDALTEYLPRMPETTHIVFVDREPDRTTRLYKQIKRLGYVLDCVTPEMGDLEDWLIRRFQKAGLAITGEALRQLIDNSGDDHDMLFLQSEADKLIGYCYGRASITLEDVQQIGSVQVKDRIFDMMTEIAMHHTDAALAIYMELLQLQTAPQVILALMIRNFNQILQVGELTSRRISEQEIAGMLHLNPWVLRNKIRPTLKAQSSRALIASLDACLQMDQEYKSGRVSPQLAVEQLIICTSTGIAIH